jgi:epoxide hydrolase 4
LNDRFATVNGVRLHFVETGQGPPVVLLHGFPEFWYSWRHQLPALAQAGFHTLALDLPGYNESERLADIKAYRVSNLVEILAQFIQQLPGPVALVGHDWGGVLAWRLASLHPELVSKLAILNAPHPAAYQAVLRCGPGQWIRSWYIAFFQLPWLPEFTIQANDFAGLERAWSQDPVHPGAFTNEDIARYKQAFGRPGGLTGPLNYYRAAIRYSWDANKPPQRVLAPTLVIWGEQDPYLSLKLLDRLGQWVPDLRIERIPDASHWIQNDVPDQVNRLLVEFFRR